MFRYLPLLLLLFTVACGPNILFEKEYQIAGPGWTYADTLDFPFAIADTNQIYDLFLEIDHSIEYPRENMYIQIYTQFPGGERIKELVSLEMAGDGGVWLGDCNSEDCTTRIPIQTGAYFDRPGDYLVTLEQYTRQDTLPGVNRIAFEIVETDSRRSQ